MKLENYLNVLESFKRYLMRVLNFSFILILFLGLAYNDLGFAKDVYQYRTYQHRAEVRINPPYALMNAIPVDYTDVFLKNADLRDSAIADASEKSAKYWSEFKGPSDAATVKNYFFDFKIYAELNLAAYRLWNDLVDCNSGSINQTRINFYLGGLCLDKNKSPALQTRLEELALNIHLFISTMEQIPDVYTTDSDAILYSPINSKLFPLITVNPHPLLVQMELQEWSMYFNLKNEPISQTTVALKNTIKYIGQRSWLDDKKNLVMQKNWVFDLPKTVTDQDIQMAQAVLNIMSLLGSHRDSYLMKPESCSFYGLWPMMNHHLMYALNNSQLSRFDLKPSIDELVFYIERMNKYAFWSCRPYEIPKYQVGYPMQGMHQDAEFYSQYGYEHILETRKLFKRFIQF